MLRAFRQFWALAALAVVGAAPAQAGMISVSIVNTDDIVIPVFDTNLGTLTGVQLQVTLLAGTTTSTFEHVPPSYLMTSTNARSNSSVNSFINGTVVSSTSGGHTHAISTTNYSAGSLNIGNFSFSTNADPDHSHTVVYNDFGLQPVSGGFRAVVRMDPQPSGSHVSSHNGATKNLSYAGPDLTPFLGPSDIVIGAGTSSTSTSGSHTHSVPGFSVTVMSSTGPWTWTFGSSTLSASGTHTHSYDPRFTTVATFFYDELVAPVPEPASLALCGIGAIGLAFGARRRRVAS